VVPVVLLLEWLAHAALVQSPGLTFHGCDDLRILHGITLEGPPPTLRFGAAKVARREGLFVAPAEVRSRRPDGRETLHARAEIILASALPQAPAPLSTPELRPHPTTPAEAYREALLFHGPALQGIVAVEGSSPAGIAGEVRCAPPAANWLRQPMRQGWLADPLALDSAFQLLILWSHEHRQVSNLPCHLRRYRQYRRGFPASGVRVVARIEHASELHALATIDLLDREGGLVARLEGYECVL